MSTPLKILNPGGYNHDGHYLRSIYGVCCFVFGGEARFDTSHGSIGSFPGICSSSTFNVRYSKWKDNLIHNMSYLLREMLDGLEVRL